jgi:hypothetical protein
MSAAKEVTRGETLLWSGVPRQGIFFRPADVILVPFSLLWAGFAVFWEATVLATPAPGFFALWGIPFVLMGLHITIGRFFVEAYRRRRTTYAVTARRIIVRSGATTQSLELATLGTISLREHSNGLGTLTFGPSQLPALFTSSSWPGAKGPPEFIQIPEARRVYERIREAQQLASDSRVV